MNAALFFRRSACNVLLSGCLIALGAGAMSDVSLVAQRGPVQRIVQGKVTNKQDAPINGAVVYLKDNRTMSLKSYITDAAGNYRFGQLSENTDYDLWAESKGSKSSTKSISSFDTKNSFHLDLKINTGN